MSSYEGECDFSFTVERMKYGDKLYSENDIYPEDAELVNIELFVHGSAFYTPGKYFGPYEDSYPSEGEEDIISVVNKDREDWFHLLTDKEISDILEIIGETVCEKHTGFRSTFN